MLFREGVEHLSNEAFRFRCLEMELEIAGFPRAIRTPEDDGVPFIEKHLSRAAGVFTWVILAPSSSLLWANLLRAVTSHVAAEVRSAGRQDGSCRKLGRSHRVPKLSKTSAVCGSCREPVRLDCGNRGVAIFGGARFIQLEEA